MCISVGDNMEAALGRIARELSELILGCQVLVYEHSVLALVHLRQNGGLGIPEETLIHFLQVHQARCGMSDDFSGLEHLQRAYEQASLALKYSGSLRGTKILNSLMELPKASPLCSFQSRVLYGILGKDRCNEANWRDSTYYKALKTLYEHDKLHGTNNLQLLRTYLWYERKATETGQVLHMHRNNVIYRISRIEQLVGLSLDDHETRIGIEMSFMLLELYSIPDNALTIDD